jgi:signal peptidase I
MSDNERKGEMKQIRWQAVILGMLMPGLGQIYNGELLKGLSFFAIYQMAVLTGFSLAVLLSDSLLVAGAALVIVITTGFYVWTIFEAGRRAVRGAEPKRYNHWYFYLAVWLICMVGINGLSIHHIRTSTVSAYRIATAYMQPTVLRGDYVLVDNTAYLRRAPQVNDIVLLVDPDNRSIVLLRKIAALPGKMIPGGTKTVPHGMIYVTGEKGGALDSSTFGFIPLRDLLGRARQIYWSSGPHGIRWGRIGMRVSSPAN